MENPIEAMEQLDEALIMPSSFFENADDLLNRYKIIYLADIYEEKPEVAGALCELWIQKCEKAKVEGRYFDRHRKKQPEDGQQYLDNLKEFLEKWGYRAKGERESEIGINLNMAGYFYKPELYLIHEEDTVEVETDSEEKTLEAE